MNTLYFLTQAGFIIVTFVYLGLVLVAVRRGLYATEFTLAHKQKILFRTVAGISLWIVLITVLSITGFLGDFSMFPPRMAIVFIVPLVSILWITFSKTFRQILERIPQATLINLQSFRLFVELLLWLLLVQNLAPEQMTLEGRNLDILTGITAPFFAYVYTKMNWPKSAAIIWNIAGLILLLNVVSTAILSLPTPFRVFMNEPSSIIVSTFPFVWLPGILVPMAYGLHFFSLRQVSTS